ncbi:MAG: PGF-CTERM sorting domain-containing protein [Halobacteriales archaeon]|nr:PGF-CTERM sorting domain-containing protein [Halobacteriales archaeon]
MTTLTTGLRRLGVVTLVVAVVASGGGAAAQTNGQPTEALVVDLAEDGDAEVTLRLTFDLATDSERQAFETLQANQTKMNEMRDSFADRLAGVATATGSETGRQMEITNATATVRTESDTGVIELSVTWLNLAAVDGEQVTLAEPFASDYSPDRQFVVTAPDGYQLSATPTPDADGDGTLRWSANTSLDGLEVTASPTESSGTTAAGQPGFTAVGAVVGLVGVGLLARRKK